MTQTHIQLAQYIDFGDDRIHRNQLVTLDTDRGRTWKFFVTEVNADTIEVMTLDFDYTRTVGESNWTNNDWTAHTARDGSPVWGY